VRVCSYLVNVALVAEDQEKVAADGTRILDMKSNNGMHPTANSMAFIRQLGCFMRCARRVMPGVRRLLSAFPRMRDMKHMLAKIGFAFSAGLALMFVAGCGLSSHPSDEVLAQRLKSNEAEFNRLAAMLFEDSDIVRLCDDCVFLSEGSNRQIPAERLREYRRLFKELGIEAGFHRDGANAVRLIASSKGGVLLPGSEKSYVYSKVEPSPLVDSLDKVVARNRGDQAPIFRKLNGNWYLYYESW